MDSTPCPACGTLLRIHRCPPTGAGNLPDLEERVAALERGTTTTVIRVVEAPPTAPDAASEREAVLRYLAWFAEEYDIAVLHRALAHIREGRHTPRPV